LIQSIVANNGDFNGTRFFSEKTARESSRLKHTTSIWYSALK